ncbi:hypothetical protein Zmor_019959 [Zophobas morio]|uniref:Gustatory receptor n=1 Tax=Zophobas morio TaxID=2755281 RepID=A0AA38I2J3_9CUCU|nr:hypothetical protein Zmor_019959 [Zophobas morio]
MFALSLKDINFIHPLCIYLRIFLITPWYDFDKNRDCGLQISKIYGIVLIVSKFYFTVLSAADDIMLEIISKFSITQTVVYYGAFVALISLNALTALKSSFFDLQNWKTLFTNLKIVDQKLGNAGDRERCLWNNFYFGFAAKQLIFLALVVFQVYTWSYITHLSAFKILFMTGFVEIFGQFLITILISCVLQVLKSRYKDLNSKLLELRNNVKVPLEMKNLARSYRILGECVHIVNSLFGYQIILIMFHFGVEIVHGLNFIIVSFDTPVEERFYGRFLVASVCVFILMTYNLFTILNPIYSATQEGKRFVDLCYKLQEEAPEGSCEGKSLLKWANISQRYVPDFSAAGFFDIDKSLIFAFAGNVATYFIITIQLNESEYLRTHKE